MAGTFSLSEPTIDPPGLGTRLSLSGPSAPSLGGRGGRVAVGCVDPKLWLFQPRMNPAPRPSGVLGAEGLGMNLKGNAGVGGGRTGSRFDW